jgi:hypothetical protein
LPPHAVYGFRHSSYNLNWFSKQSAIVLAFSNGLKVKQRGPRIAVGAFGPSLFMRDFAIGHAARGVTSVFATFVSHRSSAFLRVNRLIDFATQSTVVLHAGALVSCHNFSSLFFGFNSRSKPGRSVLTSESVTFLADNLNAEAIEAVKSWAALSNSIPVLISSLGDINSEAMF